MNNSINPKPLDDGQEGKGLRWVKASERLPEPTTGYAKQIVIKWIFEDGNVQLRIKTANEIIDLTKYLVDQRKIEWLDEGQPAQG